MIGREGDLALDVTGEDMYNSLTGPPPLEASDIQRYLYGNTKKR